MTEPDSGSTEANDGPDTGQEGATNVNISIGDSDGGAGGAAVPDGGAATTSSNPGGATSSSQGNTAPSAPAR